jgi:glucokinase
MSADPAKPAGKILLGDIGGTNARFALLSEGTLDLVCHLPTSEFPTFHAALRAYLTKWAGGQNVTAAILAVAGTVNSGRVVLTNNAWVIDAAELRAEFGFDFAQVINDFEAVGWSLTELPSDQVLKIGGDAPLNGAPLAALGPGTGLGMTVNLPRANGRAVIPSEGGHVTMAGHSAREDAVIAYLREKFGHVSAERVISGMGLENLFEALAAIDRLELPARHAADITHAAIEGSCATSRAALDMFCGMLGTVAGNLALTLGAKGGIYLAGGILRRIPAYVARSDFRARFEDKGRFRKYLEPIPVYLILDGDVAFTGLRALAAREGVA